MADQYRVKAPVVKVSIGSPDGNRVARILRAGAIVPAGVAAESLEKLAERGFIEEADDAEEDEPEAPAQPEPLPPVSGDESPAVDSEQFEVAAPPKAGPGSSAEAWRTYAASIGVDVDAGASRDDVIAALEAAGKPTE